MSLIVFQHEPHEPASCLARVLQDHGHRLRTIALHHGAAVPSDLDDVDGVISMGGAANVDQTSQYKWLVPEMTYLQRAHAAGVPMVGVCLGAQLLAAALGGKVAAMARPEVGWHEVNLTHPGKADPILGGIPWNSMQFHLHAQEATELPPDAVVLAESRQCRHQAFRVGLRTYAFQYHFEWVRPQLEQMSRDGLVKQAGESSDAIAAAIARQYDTYRRLGDRLCDNLATFLFPIDKR